MYETMGGNTNLYHATAEYNMMMYNTKPDRSKQAKKQKGSVFSESDLMKTQGLSAPWLYSKRAEAAPSADK